MLRLETRDEKKEMSEIFFLAGNTFFLKLNSLEPRIYFSRLSSPPPSFISFAPVHHHITAVPSQVAGSFVSEFWKWNYDGGSSTYTHTHTQDPLACEYRWSHANSGCRIKNTGNAFAVRTNDDEWRAILSRRHVPLAKNHSFILGSWFGFNGEWRGERGHRFASLAVLSSCFSNFWEFITNYARSAELYVRIIHTFKENSRFNSSARFLHKFKVDLSEEKTYIFREKLL